MNTDSLMFGIIIIGVLIVVFGIFSMALLWWMLGEVGDMDGDRKDWWERPPFRAFVRRGKNGEKNKDR